MGMQLAFGFEINIILENVINKEKATTVFANLDKTSLQKIVRYCFSNTAYKMHFSVIGILVPSRKAIAHP